MGQKLRRYLTDSEHLFLYQMRKFAVTDAEFTKTIPRRIFKEVSGEVQSPRSDADKLKQKRYKKLWLKELAKLTATPEQFNELNQQACMKLQKNVVGEYIDKWVLREEKL